MSLKRSQKPLALFGIIGLVGLTLVAVWYWIKNQTVTQQVLPLGYNPLQPGQAASTTVVSSPEANAIRDTLAAAGVVEQTVKYWIAVSGFETDKWRSQVFQDSNNLFCLIVPGSNRLAYGEGQTIYPNITAAAQALLSKVIYPFAYPKNYASIDSLVSTMKAKGFFTGNESVYAAGVKQIYLDLFLTNP
jgi:hypothetical protein